MGNPTESNRSIFRIPKMTKKKVEWENRIIKVLDKKWCEKPKVIQCPLNPPNKDFKHYIGTGQVVQCYQCGQSFREAGPMTNKKKAKKISILLAQELRGLRDEIDKLADFFLNEMPEEIREGSAVDNAIRLLRFDKWYLETKQPKEFKTKNRRKG